MTALCCLCLKKSKNYTIVEDETDEICDQMQSCLQLKINFDIVKNVRICDKCLSELATSHIFFKKVHNAHLAKSLKMELPVSECKKEIKPLSLCEEDQSLNNNCIQESIQDDELNIKDEEDLEEFFNDDEVFRYDSDNSEEEREPVNALATIKNWISYPWYCYLCIYSTLNFTTLMGHMKTKHDICSTKKMQYQCVDCTKKINGYCNFLNHVRLEHQPGLKLCCDICGEVSSDYAQLSEHRKGHNEESEMQQPMVYNCNHCSRTYPSRTSINKHILTHEQGLKCQDCDKSFKRLKYLKRHREMHAELKHKCDFCDKSFHRKFNKINHERTHTGERPYTCSHCDRSFSFQSTLKSHERTHTGEMPYKCSICKAKFRHSDSLKEHMRSHSKENPIICTVCNASFSYRKSLHRHMKNIHKTVLPKKVKEKSTKSKSKKPSPKKKPTKNTRAKKSA